MSSKLDNLYNQIKEIDELKHLLIDDIGTEYSCTFFCYSKHFTHLHKCVMNTREYSFLNEYICEYLKQNPNEVNVQNKKGYTALMLASANSRSRSTEETVKILLNYEQNINIRNIDGSTALLDTVISMGSGSSSVDTVKILLEHGANVNAQNKYGITPLSYAGTYFHLPRCKQLIKLLLKYNADINEQPYGGRTILMSSILNLSYTYKITKMILKYGADVNAQDISGMTALFYAIYIKNNDLIKILLKYGADIHLKNNNDENIIVYALKRYTGAVDILLSTRQKFTEKVTTSKKQITKTEFWRMKNCDFKIIYPSITNINDIIMFM